MQLHPLQSCNCTLAYLGYGSLSSSSLQRKVKTRIRFPELRMTLQRKFPIRPLGILPRQAYPWLRRLLFDQQRHLSPKPKHVDSHDIHSSDGKIDDANSSTHTADVRLEEPASRHDQERKIFVIRHWHSGTDTLPVPVGFR